MTPDPGSLALAASIPVSVESCAVIFISMMISKQEQCPLHLDDGI